MAPKNREELAAISSEEIAPTEAHVSLAKFLTENTPVEVTPEAAWAFIMGHRIWQSGPERAAEKEALKLANAEADAAKKAANEEKKAQRLKEAEEKKAQRALDQEAKKTAAAEKKAAAAARKAAKEASEDDASDLDVDEDVTGTEDTEGEVTEAPKRRRSGKSTGKTSTGF